LIRVAWLDRSSELQNRMNKARISEAANLIARRWNRAPRVGIILGTGLGAFADQLDVEAYVDYEEIPHFPCSTAPSHKGRLVCGSLAGQPVVAMEGRFHLYEGHTAAEVALPVHVLRALGVRLLIVSNACGGLNPHFAKGDIMVIEDHINLMFASPLTGANDDTLGPRFPDMSAPYDALLIDQACEIARQENFAIHRGVYVGVRGPNLETRAEYRLMRTIGGDVVGMSTVPEVIAAAHAKLRVLGLATVTNVCLPDALHAASSDDIIAVAAAAEPKLRAIVTGVVAAEARFSTLAGVTN
jgi:purine-nucleoside phosphorylase